MKKIKPYDALSDSNNSIEQKRHIHKLFEKKGKTLCSTKARDTIVRSGLWDYDLFVNDEDFLVATSSRSLTARLLNYHSYQWWVNALDDRKYIDNSNESSKNTHLDKQIEFLESKNKK
jgi:hypothetical protein